MISQMNMMVDVTEEQLNKEKEYQDIVEMYVSKEITEEEAYYKIRDLLKKAYKDGIFSKDDIRSYNYRRDPPSSKYATRSHIKFAMDLRNSHLGEVKTMKYFVASLQETDNDVDYESLGTDDNGYVMVANFQKRYDTPNRPDYKVMWGGKWRNVEVKNFKPYIWIKLCNLEKYKEWKSYILIGWKGSYYLFCKKAVVHLLENMKGPPSIVCGKPAIVITMDGENTWDGHKAHYSLKKLIEIGAVKSV